MTLYYYNNNWQVLNETDENGMVQTLFIYGNYIDEVLMRMMPFMYYVHDHLYSPAALTASTGVVIERYEYDAYGNFYVLEPNFANDPDGKSNYGNPYLFTGRRVDILDNGSLKIQYNRNRCYDYYTGRWLTHDPLGINPAGGMENPFYVLNQYLDSLQIYEYATGNPVVNTDPYGLLDCWIDREGLIHCQPTDPTDPMPPSLSPLPCCRSRYMGEPRWDEVSEWVKLFAMGPFPGPRRRSSSWPVFRDVELWPNWRTPDPRFSPVLVGLGCSCHWKKKRLKETTCCVEGEWTIVDSEWEVVGAFVSKGKVERNTATPIFRTPPPFRCSCRRMWPALTPEPPRIIRYWSTAGEEL